MGKQKQFIAITTTVADAIDTARSGFEELRDEYQDWYDNLPESFQNGSKGEELQSAIDQLEQAINEAEGIDPHEKLGELAVSFQVVVRPKSMHVSRAMRGSDATDYLHHAKAALEAARDARDDKKNTPKDTTTPLDPSAALEESIARLRALFEAGAEQVIVTDDRGGSGGFVVTASKAAESFDLDGDDDEDFDYDSLIDKIDTVISEADSVEYVTR